MLKSSSRGSQDGSRGAQDASKTPPRRLLGSSWAENGANMAPTWLQLGSKNGAKTSKKPIENMINFLMPLGIDF